MFTINVLLYGDNPKLAVRCLSSIQARFDPELVEDVRIGLNEISQATSEIVHEFARTLPAPVHLFRERKKCKNVMKYPMMKRMLYCDIRPIEKATRVMWFDDDSFVRNKPGERWLKEIDGLWKAEKPTIMGSVYKPGYRWTPSEMACFRSEPWYTGVPMTEKPNFVTGGWWVADLEFLSKWGYPIDQLKHNGGDVLLGEICRQQDAKILHHKRLVAINADEFGNESKAKRRGVTTDRAFTIGDDPFDKSHHDWDCLVDTYEADGRLRNCA